MTPVRISKLNMLEISVHLSEEFGLSVAPYDLKRVFWNNKIDFQLAPQILSVCGVHQLQLCGVCEVRINSEN